MFFSSKIFQIRSIWMKIIKQNSGNSSYIWTFKVLLQTYLTFQRKPHMLQCNIKSIIYILLKHMFI